MRHIISCLVQNRSGVLARVAGLFAGRGFNIDSLVVGRTDDPKTSRMTITVVGGDEIIEQVRKQLEKLIEVIKVFDMSGGDYVERDLLLVRLHAPPAKRAEIMQVTEIFRGKIVHVANRELLVELSGTEDKVDAFLDVVRPYGIKEVARTGRIAVMRGQLETRK